MDPLATNSAFALNDLGFCMASLNSLSVLQPVAVQQTVPPAKPLPVLYINVFGNPKYIFHGSVTLYTELPVLILGYPLRKGSGIIGIQPEGGLKKGISLTMKLFSIRLHGQGSLSLCCYSANMTNKGALT